MNDFDDLPKLPRLRRFDQQEGVDQDKEVHYPKWNCYCCHDSGIVTEPELVIEGYGNFDLGVVCCKPGCKAGTLFLGRGIMDERFTEAICIKLHNRARQNWLKTIREEQKRKVDLAAAAKLVQMPGSGERSQLDEERRDQKLAEVAAIAHEEWLKMSNQYLGGE